MRRSSPRSLVWVSGWGHIGSISTSRGHFQSPAKARDSSRIPQPEGQSAPLGTTLLYTNWAFLASRKPDDIRRVSVQEVIGPGRPGWLPTQVPHRSGLAHHAHPVPHLMNSRPARSVVVTWTWFRSRCTCQVSLQRLMRRHPLPSTGSIVFGTVSACCPSLHIQRLPVNLICLIFI